MQDIHAIGGGAGRLFMAGVGGGGSGGGTGGDRRLRPHSHQNHQQPMKCPRCDSLNTKFCYYNNYNLSQPRHFCKSCRRYWTKGGVLRNVPIGGGCRKSKRSKTKPSSSATTDAVAGEQKSNSHSSSESSSLTGTAITTEVVSATIRNSNLLNFADSSRFLISQNCGNVRMNDDDHSEDGQILSDMMMSWSSEAGLMGFNSLDVSASYGLQEKEQKMVESSRSEYLDEINNNNNNMSALQQQQQQMRGGFSSTFEGEGGNYNCGEDPHPHPYDDPPQAQGMFDFSAGSLLHQPYCTQTQWPHHHNFTL